MQNLAPELEHPRRPEVENEDREMPDLDPAYAFRITSRIMRHLNKNYFRSRFVGFEQPIRGKHPGAPVIYASNHSGMAFPWDGMALSAGVFERSGYQLKDAMRPIASPLLSKHRAMSPFMVEGSFGCSTRCDRCHHGKLRESNGRGRCEPPHLPRRHRWHR